MPRKGKRRLVDKKIPNIYVDGSGYFSVIIKVAGKPEEDRFPPGTPLDILEAHVAKLKGKARRKEKPRAGSLAADALDYLATIGDKDKLKRQTIIVGHWTARYGRESRFALTKLKIEQQLASWEKAGVAASTCNKRLSTLRALFNAVNDDDDPNPTIKVTKRREPDPQPRAIDYSVIDRIFAKMTDRGRPTGAGKGTRPTVGLTKLRLAFMAYTSLPPAQMIKIDPARDIRQVTIADAVTGVKRKTHMLRARPRRKGKGTREDWNPLLPQAFDILQLLIKHKALKKFSTQSARKVWQRACVKVIIEQLAANEEPLPHRLEPRGEAIEIVALVRPYDLRHSFLTHALRSSGNLAGVQRLGMHSDSRTTLRYLESGIFDAAASVVGAMHSQLPANPVPDYVKAKPDGTETGSGLDSTT